MRRRLARAALALVVLIAMLPSTVSADDPPPHKDPKTESGAFSAISMLGYFGLITSLMAEADFDDVPALLEQLRHANIPSDLRFVIDRYSELLGDSRNELNATDRSLGRAATFLSRGNDAQANRQLKSVPPSLERAGRLLEDLEIATDSLGRRLGVFGLAAGNALTRAYDELQTLLVRLEQLRQRYEQILRELESGVINLSLATVGQSGGAGQSDESSSSQSGIVSGLQEIGQGQPRTSQGPRALGGSAQARETGVPIVGLGRAVPVRLYQTEVGFQTPPNGYPGRAIRIVGRVSTFDGPDLSRIELQIALDGSVIDAFSGGMSFDRDLVIPADAATGQHQLSVVVPPQGDYDESSASRALEISRVQPSLRVRAAKWTFWTQRVEFSGEVGSEFSPVVGGDVRAVLGNAESTVTTDAEGRFSGVISLGLGDLVLGVQSLRVEVTPREPWHSGVAESQSIVVVNVINVGLASFGVMWLMVALSVLWLRRWRAERHPAIEAMTSVGQGA